MSRDCASRQVRPLAAPVAIAALLAVAVLAGACATGDVGDTERLQAQSTYEVGVAHLERREWAAALTTFRQAIAIDPTVPQYRNGLGIALIQLGQPALALPEFVRATELDRDYAEAHLNTGIAYAEMGRWDEAVTAYQRAIRLPRLTSPDTAHSNLGLALYHLRRFQEAERALEFALNLNPEMEGAWYNLGMVLTAMDRKDAARAAYRHAREIAPNSPFGRAAAERLKALGDGG